MCLQCFTGTLISNCTAQSACWPVLLIPQVRRFLAENDEVSKLRERQGLVDLEHFNLQHETSLQGVFGVRQDQLDSLCDGESDSTGLQWPLHVRDRLPLDLLSCLPGAVKAVGDRKGAPAAAAAGGGGEAAPGGNAADAGAAGGKVAGAADDADAAEGLGDGAEGGAQDGAAVMYQFRPQIQVGVQTWSTGIIDQTVSRL